MKPFIILIFASLFFAACGNAPAPITVPYNPLTRKNGTGSSRPVPSKPVNAMTWAGADGKAVSLDQLKGKAVILDFWATYCPPCIEEIPHLNELQAKYGVDNLQVIGLNSGGLEDRPKIADFAKLHKITYPIAFPDDDLEAFIFSETDAIPQTAVFDRTGKLVTKIIGFDPTIKRDLDTAVETALKSP